MSDTRSRLPALTRDAYSADQKALFDAITGGKRAEGKSPDAFILPDGALRGPFQAWLHQPAVGGAAQRVGEVLRYEGILPDTAREVAILTVGRHWKAQYEWWAHARIAERVGVAPEIIQAIYDRAPLPTDDETLLTVHAFARELLETGNVGDDAYAAANAAVGPGGTVELVILVGYYGMISATLNVFRAPMPPGAEPPFPE